MFRTWARLAKLELQVMTAQNAVADMRGEVARLAERIERGSTTQLRADVDNLTGRIESLAKSMQKQFGALYAERTAVKVNANGDLDDPELANLLEFQRNFSQGGH